MVEDVIGRAWGYRYDLAIHRPTLIAMFEALEWCISPLYAAGFKPIVPGRSNSQDIEYYFNKERYQANPQGIICQAKTPA
jgi:hypothetical protein